MKSIKFLTAILFTLFILGGVAYATPSTTFWTPMTLDIQPYGVLHLGVDDYFRVFTKSSQNGSFPTDLTLPEIGVLPFEKIQMEVGADYMANTDYPWMFNAKIGSPEDSFFKGQPALEIGIFNVGTKKDVTNQDIVYGVIGKSIPVLGRLSVGPYIGNSSVLRDNEGNKKNTGFMAAFDHGFIPIKDKDGNVDYNKLVFAADYASGKNSLGGGGFGLYYYFTKDISLLTGPVWFNEKAINGEWKWTIQLDINVPIFGK